MFDANTTRAMRQYSIYGHHRVPHGSKGACKCTKCCILAGSHDSPKWDKECGVNNILSESRRTPRRNGYLRLPGGSTHGDGPTLNSRDAPSGGCRKQARGPARLDDAAASGAIPLPPDLGIPSSGLQFVGDLQVRTVDPDSQPDRGNRRAWQRCPKVCRWYKGAQCVSNHVRQA